MYTKIQTSPYRYTVIKLNIMNLHSYVHITLMIKNRGVLIYSTHIPYDCNRFTIDLGSLELNLLQNTISPQKKQRRPLDFMTEFNLFDI